jgi:hypothetical protein
MRTVLHLTIRDAIWMLLLAATATCWYVDRGILADRNRNLERAIEVRDSMERKSELERKKEQRNYKP